MQFQTNSQIGNRGIHLSTAAVEVGFGDTKWAYRDATGTLVRKSFPSLAPKFLDDVRFPRNLVHQQVRFMLPAFPDVDL